MFVLLRLEPFTSLFSSFGRVHGLFKDPNVMGPFLIVPILLLSDWLWQSTLPLHRIGLSLPQALLLLGLLMAGGRAAIGALVISLLTLWVLRALLHRKQARRIALQGVMGLVAVVALVVGLYQLSDLFIGRFSLFQTYDSALRFPTQLAGLRLGLANPLGVGPGAFEEQFGTFSAHSLYVRGLVENGWIGFAGLCGLIGITTWELAKRVRMMGVAQRRLPSVEVLFAWWIGVLANSVVIDTLHWRHFWLLLGLIWLRIMQEEEGALPQAASPERPRRTA